MLSSFVDIHLDLPCIVFSCAPLDPAHILLLRTLSCKTTAAFHAHTVRCAGLVVLGNSLYMAMGDGPLSAQNGSYGNAVINMSIPDLVV